MSTLSSVDRVNLEKFLRMSGGYVLNFNDRTFGDFGVENVGIDIHDAKYTVGGSSKANKLRSFWQLESDSVVGKLLLALIDYEEFLVAGLDADATALAEKCRQIAMRLLAGGMNLDPLKQQAEILNASHLKDQIRRMEASLEADPSLAIGTAKELVETCCKTILAERGKPVSGTPEISTLTKDTLKELKLVPEDVPEAARGADVIRRLLKNLGTIGNGLAELRGLYGTGHGKHGSTTGLGIRHAKLAVGAAATLCVFLFETHTETKR